MDELKKEIFKYYYEIASEKSPESIEYLDFVNQVIVYLFEIYNDFDFDNNIHYGNYISKKERNALCIDILRSIDIKYSHLFCQYLKDNRIRKSRVNHSYAGKNICVYTTNTFEDVITTLHEFGHKLHQMYRNPDPKNNDYWHSTEMFAMTFEFYTLFYMARNGMLDEDIKKSFLLYMEGLYVDAYNVIGQALALNIIDKYGDLRKKDINAYKDEYGINSYYLKYLTDTTVEKMILENDNKYTFKYRYLFGLPMALYMGNRMATSESYKERFVENYSRIGELGSNKFLKEMSAYQIVTDPSCLEWVMAHAYSYTMHIVNDNEFKPKMIKFKR